MYPGLNVKSNMAAMAAQQRLIPLRKKSAIFCSVTA